VILITWPCLYGCLFNQSLSWEFESTKHIIEWLLVLACLVHQYSEIRDLVSCPPSLPETRLFVCNFCFSLHLDPFQCDPKKDLACMWDKSSCSVICTLFKITFLGKWDERGERPFLLSLTTFSHRHTYSVHSVQYCLSSCFKLFCWDLARTCDFATCCLLAYLKNEIFCTCYPCPWLSLPLTAVCLGSPDIFKFWQMIDSVSVTVQNRDIVARED